MASSQTPGPTGGKKYQLTCSPNTPGPLGVNDQASPEAMCLVGDTPGPVGVRDLAGSELMCLTEGPGPIDQSRQEHEVDTEVVVFDVHKLLTWAEWPASKAGTISDSATIAKLFRDFGLSGLADDLLSGRVSYYIKSYGGKDYIIFKGYPGLRSTLTGTKYLANNTKVLNMAIGKAGVIRSGMRGGMLTIVFVCAIDVAEYLLDDEMTLADLGVSLFSDLTKAAVATAIGTAVGVLLAGAIGGAVIVPIAAAVAVGVVVSLGLEWLDARFELTKSLRKWANDEWERIQRDYENTKYETRKWWKFLNTPEGYFWLMNELSW